jgi:hypothetical protein
VELADALLEKLLREGDLGGDGEVDIAGVAHEVGGTARAFVECLAVVRVAGEGAGGVRGVVGGAKRADYA